MDKECLDILTKWSVYSKYNPEQTKFSVGSFISEYDMHKVTGKIEHIINEYDDSGMLAVIVIKNFFLRMATEKRFQLIDYLRNSGEFKTHMDMYEMFFSDIIVDAERNYVHKLYTLASKITSTGLLETKEQFVGIDSILSVTETVIDALDGLNFESYKIANGGEIGSITHVSTSIHVFPSLRDCLLSLENTEDGMYLCYIDVNHTADGYFGFFVKSNDNIFSLNERINEAYKGSHQHSRNGRWSEKKQDALFPYDYIFSYGEYDYKGYGHNYMIDDEKLSFFCMKQEAYMPLLLAMVFIIRKYSGKIITEEPVYVDSFLQVNLKAIAKDITELAVINQSPIVQYHKQLDFEFDEKSILDGSAYNEVNDIVFATNRNQTFIDLYSNGFKIKPTILSTQIFLTDGQYKYAPEFVGDGKKMKAQAYYEIRKQLADYIREQMRAEYDRYGGYKAVYNWFKENVRKSIPSLESLIKKKYLAVEKGEDRFIDIGLYSGDFGVLYDISIIKDSRLPNIFDVFIANAVNTEKEYIDTRCSTKCSVWFVFKPHNYRAFAELFDTEIPKILTGWKINDSEFDLGNPILDMTDEVDRIGTPFELREYKKYKDSHAGTFKFAIGYSKNGLKKMLKETE